VRRHCTERTPARATVQARASAHPNYAAMMGGYRQVATASASRGPNPFGQEGCEDFEPQPRQNVRAATCNSFGGGSRRLGCFGTTSQLVRFVNCRMRQYYAANAIGKWVLGCAHPPASLACCAAQPARSGDHSDCVCKATHGLNARRTLPLSLPTTLDHKMLVQDGSCRRAVLCHM
jgi:hypothetical protein